MILLALGIIISLDAQNKKVRAGFFKHWYIGAFNEVVGKYSIPIDTATYDFESYDEDEAAFWAEQYDHYYTVFDSLRLVIKKDLIIYNNEIFENVYTIRADAKKHAYYILGRSSKERTLTVIIQLTDTSEWQIYVSYNENQGWGGIWRRSEI